MKDGVKYLVGKQIVGVVVARSAKEPRHQIFLVFPDGSRFEIYGENFTCCSGLDRAAGIENYVRSGGGEIVQVHVAPRASTAPVEAPLTTGPERAPYHVPAPETLVDAMSRDLKAWELAKAVVGKARRG